MQDSSNWIQFGYILRAHGVRGELRLIPLGDIPFPAELNAVRVVSRSGETSVCEIVAIREIHDAYLLTLREVKGRNEAAALKGASVLIPQSALPALGEGEYYLFELVGASVQNASGEVLGEVAELFDNAGQTLLKITHDSSERLLPAVDETITSFDRIGKVLVVSVPDGLWEDN